MFNKKSLFLSAALCTLLSSAYAGKPGEVEGTYTRPGTNLVIKAEKEGDQPSAAVQQLLKEKEDLLAPTTDLKTLNDFFKSTCDVSGPVNDIFDLYDSSKADLTVAQQALALLPQDHVLSVHTFQPTTTQEGKPAILSQCSESSNGVPTNFTGAVKYQTRDGNELLDVKVLFDLTGSKKPTLSVVRHILADAETGTEFPEKQAFEKEIEALGAGVKHVAVYAAGDKVIPITQNDKSTTAKAVSRTINLED